MKMKSLILIFIALGCGLVASIGISQVMTQGGKDAKVEMDQILVAKDSIDSGKKLEAAMVQFEEWPKQRVPDGAIRKIEEAEGKYSIYRFFKGEPILAAKINDKPTGVVLTIPDGYRVTPIKVDEDTVMEAITPGDTVDVSVFLESGKNGIGETGVYTILTNVRVFAKGGQTERTVDETGKEVKARTVSLLVKPAQWRELVLAYRLGKISLALRPQGAGDEQLEETITPLSDLLAAKGSNASEPASSSSSGIGQGSALPFLTANQPQTSEPAGGPKMRVLSPSGASDWLFPEDGGPAVESVLYGSGSAPPAKTNTTTQPTSAPAPGSSGPVNDPTIPQ